MLYYELLTEGETITANVYVQQIPNLATAIEENRRRRAEVHLLHDNTRPHVASAAKEILKEFFWVTVPHPPYFPDLAPSDYHLFRNLEQFLA